MNPQVDPLVSILDQEIDAYRKMQTMLTEEKNAATLSSREHLMDIGRRKQAWVEQLKQLEQERRRLTVSLARDTGIDADPVTVERLASVLDPPTAGRLRSRAKTLKALMQDVQTANRANSQLIGHYLKLIQGALNLLNDMVYTRFVYARPGSAKRSGGYAGSGGKVFCGDI